MPTRQSLTMGDLRINEFSNSTEKSSFNRKKLSKERQLSMDPIDQLEAETKKMEELLQWVRQRKERESALM